MANFHQIVCLAVAHPETGVSDNLIKFNSLIQNTLLKSHVTRNNTAWMGTTRHGWERKGMDGDNTAWMGTTRHGWGRKGGRKIGTVKNWDAPVHFILTPARPGWLFGVPGRAARRPACCEPGDWPPCVSCWTGSRRSVSWRCRRASAGGGGEEYASLAGDARTCPSTFPNTSRRTALAAPTKNATKHDKKKYKKLSRSIPPVNLSYSILLLLSFPFQTTWITLSFPLVFLHFSIFFKILFFPFFSEKKKIFNFFFFLFCHKNFMATRNGGKTWHTYIAQLFGRVSFPQAEVHFVGAGDDVLVVQGILHRGHSLHPFCMVNFAGEKKNQKDKPLPCLKQEETSSKKEEMATKHTGFGPCQRGKCESSCRSSPWQIPFPWANNPGPKLPHTHTHTHTNQLFKKRFDKIFEKWEKIHQLRHGPCKP